ncbi:MULTISPECIES: hypothetical protein [unclassified Sphingomonas]|uniref:hypothetical protein n=1 Tax=unclassified Sphingomonas TaxID=196159 RepID=UPI00226A8889|nr:MULTISPECIES: hypothetical protein [unclassified Sphingomonas]
MSEFTIGDCERQVDLELAAADRAADDAERKAHLNRAAIFAHCCEEGVREAKFTNSSLGNDFPCQPDVFGAAGVQAHAS